MFKVPPNLHHHQTVTPMLPVVGPVVDVEDSEEVVEGSEEEEEKVLLPVIPIITLRERPPIFLTPPFHL